MSGVEDLHGEPETPEPERVTGQVVSLRPEYPSPVPEHSEFLTMATQAVLLAKANAVPAALRNKPHDVLLVLMTARDLGLSVTNAMRCLYVINGVVTVAPKARIARVHQIRAGRIVPGETNDIMHAAAYPVDAAGRSLGPPSVFTWADAQRATLVDPRCEPDAHWKPSVGNGKCNCKDNWKMYPQRMLWWRAAGYCADDYFPEAGFGIYSPDEMGATTDADGVPITLDRLELPPGFEAGAGQQPIAEAKMADLRGRIEALDDAHRQWLRDQWVLSLPPLSRLTTVHYVQAIQLISMAETMMDAAGGPVDTEADDPPVAAPAMPVEGLEHPQEATFVCAECGQRWEGEGEPSEIAECPDCGGDWVDASDAPPPPEGPVTSLS